MCGIIGLLKSHISEKDVKEFNRMRDSMAHRGPDSYGTVQTDNFILGHRRLSIIDLSVNGNQPMCTEDRRYYISYNGELYNFSEIKNNLIKTGYSFSGGSDTEVVLKAYAEYGPACLDKFNGMFAFAVLDTFKKEIFLARDRFGQKPLYYYLKSGIFFFASELRAFEENPDIALKKSLEAVNCYLALGYVLGPKTIYEDVFQLEPATYLKIDHRFKIVEKVRYWKYEDYFFNKTTDSDTVKKEKIFSLLEKSVKMRMVSDVKLGSFLSGGIDSGIVTYLLAANSPKPLSTFGIGFGLESYNESDDALKLAKYLSTHHISKIIDKDTCLKLFREATSQIDGLLADNSFIPMYALSELASRDVKVVLSGDGGDEIFAGYPTYRANLLYKTARYIPKLLLRFLSGRRNTDRKIKLGRGFKCQQFFHGSQFNYRKAHYSWRLVFRPGERAEIMGNENRDLIYDTDPFRDFDRYYDKVKGLNGTDQHLFVDAQTWLADDILPKIDRSSMLHGLEVRTPFLDRDFVEYAASLEAKDKLNIFGSKIILKKAFKDKLPDFVFRKPKSGFNMPLAGCIQAGFFNEFQDYTYFLYKKKGL